MSKYPDIDAFMERIARQDELFKNKLLEALNNETSAGAVKSYKEYGVREQKIISDIFRDSVNEFYDAYNPILYHRTFGLYDVLNLSNVLDEYGMVTVGGDGFGYEPYFDETRLHRDRSGNSLFDKVFMKGWHGGAEKISPSKAKIWHPHPDSGVPYYRTYGPVWYPGAKKAKMHRYGIWGDVAKQTESPYQIFSKKMKDAESGILYKELYDIAHKNNNAAVEKFKRMIPQIREEVYGR